MKDILRELFTFSAGERKGIIILIFLVMLTGGINLLIITHHSSIAQPEPAEWMNDSGILSVPPAPAVTDKVAAEEHVNVTAAGKELFPFDPNESTFDELLRLGFSYRESRTILNYRSKGGKFRVPGDLEKIFGISPAHLTRIAGYVKIKHPAETRYNTSTGKAVRQLLDINMADSSLLERLPGIGPVLARRIIRYRSLLGGYYTTEQVKEVYGVSDSLYLTIKNRLAADTSGLKKINLNTATEREIARHPYIGKYLASGIVRYRMHVFRIGNINELKINGLITGEELEKIRNYVSL